MMTSRSPFPSLHTTAVVTFPGEADYGTAGQIATQLATALAPGVTTVIADLTATTICDSSGLRVIVAAHKRALATGTYLRLVVPPGPLTRIFAITGLDRYLAIYPTIHAALITSPAPSADHHHTRPDG